MKFIHTADLHLGFNTFRGENKYNPFKSLDFAVEYSIEKKVDLFLIAGDVFDRRDPSSFIQQGFAEEVKKLVEKNITVFIVTGNHEGAPSPERNIHLDVYNALRIKGIHIAKKIMLYELPDVNIISVPYPYKKNLLVKEEYRNKNEEEVTLEMNRIIIETIKEYISKTSNNNPTILAAHIPVSEGKVGSERYSTFSAEMPISKSELDIKGISYIALGHLHTAQTFTTTRFKIPLVYAGSIDRIDFSEESDDKGFFEVEMKKGTKSVFNFVKNPYARKFYTIRVKNDSNLSNVNFEKAKESITRIVLHKDIENETLLKTLIKKLQKEALVFAGVEDKRNLSNESNFSHLHLSVKPVDAIRQYIDENKIKNTFINKEKDKILKTALNLLKEAKE